MNILIVAYWHDPRFKHKPGGLIRMYELADNLIGLGHEVTLMVPDLGFPKSQTRAKVVAVPFIDLPIFRPLSFHLLATLCLLTICRKKVDRIYVRQMNSFLPFFVSKLFNIFSYFEIPNDPYIGYSSIGKYKRPLIQFIDRLCMRLTDQIVVLSEWSKSRIVSMGSLPAAKVLVFPSGTDTSLFHPMSKEAACQKIGVDPNHPYIGFIGSFLVHQGIDLLIDAAPLILEEKPDTRFLMVGDGPMRPVWNETIQKMGLKEQFIFTGHVPYREVPVYIGAMDICVAPHHRETNQASPVKLFDYMASARPVVASKIDVVEEIIAGCGCAVLVEPDSYEELAKGIISLLHNPALADELGNRGRYMAMARYDRKILTADLFSSQGKSE
ncbi:MAG: D-inositol-3-phosphate glycosyltransferase [Syntrophus sp. SKADARSKE-3]|nr:D-inositol-3-phosphate glycosyltransferase [Syntrophus sp. SKADARSKE-3]